MHLDIFAEPFEHLFPVCPPLIWLRCACMPCSGSTHHLHWHLSHHLEPHIDLFALRDRTSQVIFWMNKQGWCPHIRSSVDWRTLLVTLGPCRVPRIAFGLRHLPVTNI